MHSDRTRIPRVAFKSVREALLATGVVQENAGGKLGFIVFQFMKSALNC